MQQFVVPQFIDVEDKVIGPITVRQFIILLAAGGAEFLVWKYSDFTMFLFLTVLNGIFTIFFAFIKINGRPVHYFILNFIQTSKKARLRLWHKEFQARELRFSMGKKEAKVLPKVLKPTLASTRLAELSLIVDTGGVYEGEELNLNKNKIGIL